MKFPYTTCYIALILIDLSAFIALFCSSEKQLAAAVLAAVTTGLISVLVVFQGKQIDEKHKVESELRIQKAKVYEEFLVANAMCLDGHEVSKDFLPSFSAKLICWSNEAIISKFDEYRKAIAKQDSAENNKLFHELIELMRQDIGNTPSISKETVARLLTNDYKTF